VVSWGWEPEKTNLLSLDAHASQLVLEQEWQGTLDPAAYLAVPAAIQFQTDHDWLRARSECHELLREARRRFYDLTGLPPICPDSTDWYVQMASFPLPPCDGAQFQRRLYDDFRVEVPVIEWNARQLLRVSVQGYNTAEDVEALLRCLAGLLTEG
jgi:isopenicillin-N epimerase